MPKFSFDIEMSASITVEAESAEAAEKLISDKLDQAGAKTRDLRLGENGTDLYFHGEVYRDNHRGGLLKAFSILLR